jgi:O-antigen/teichoic acid export membrane protein
MNQSSIKKDIFWNTIGSLVSGFVFFILTVFITRLNGIHASGSFGFAFSIVAIFSTIAYYGGRNYQVTDVSGEFETGDYVKLRLSTSFIAVLTLVIFIEANNFNSTVSLLIIVLMGYRLLDAVSDVLYGILQIHDRLHQAGKSNFIKSLLSIVGFMAVDYATHSILLSSLVFIVVFLLGIFLLDINNIHKINPVKIKFFGNWNIKKIALKLLPFALVIFIPIVTTNLTKYFIQLWHPSDQGYFNILIMPLFFLTLLVYFVVAPFLTRIARTLQERRYVVFKKNINQISFFIVGIGTILLPITYFLGPIVLKIIFGIDFKHFATQLTLIVISGILYTLAIFYTDILLILRKVKTELAILIAILVINIAISIFLIPRYAINGAIAVSIVTNALWLIAFWLVYYITLRKKMDK